MNRFVITCVKLGLKYPTEMVNKLYKMCVTNISFPFDFFCYTDDPRGIDLNIHTIPYVDHGIDNIVYNKLYLFSDEIENYLPQNPRVYFDLDLIVKSNIDDILNNHTHNLTLIDAEWRRKHDYGFPTFHHPYNSSCMRWNKGEMQSIWRLFIQNPEYYMNKYHWGMDSFMFYEHKNAGVKIGYFPHRKFYSFLYGVDYAENIIHDPILHGYKPSRFVDVVDKIPVVLLNGPVNNTEYLKMYKKIYGD